MNWKAVGLGSGKTYATGTHADCIMAISDGEHVEAIRVMREGEHILSNEEELEVIEEKMRQVKEKKHIQLEIKKAALAEIREQKRIAAEQEEIRIENIRLESIARQQAAKEAAKLTSKPKKEKPERVMPIAKMPAPRKRLKRDAWSSAEKMDTAQIIKPDDMPDESDISAVKIGKVVPYDSVKVDFKDMPPIEISDGCSNEPDMIQKPPHHNKFTFQPIDIIAEVTNYYEGSTAFHIGTALKYLCRAPFKGKLIEDLKKANYYLTRAIDEMEE